MTVTWLYIVILSYNVHCKLQYALQITQGNDPGPGWPFSLSLFSYFGEVSVCFRQNVATSNFVLYQKQYDFIIVVFYRWSDNA